MQFYVLGNLRLDEGPYESRASAMKPENVGEASKCPICHQWVSMIPWLPPYHAEIIVHGQKLGDLVKGYGESFLVSDRFRRAWLEEKLQGIDVFSSVKRLRVRPARLRNTAPPYYHIAVRLFDVMVDVEHSRIEYRYPINCPRCKGGACDSVRGFALDETTWRGEDIFEACGMSGIFIVSDRVRALRDKHGLTNINLTPIEEYLWDPEKRWTPWCYYLPDGFVHREEHEYEYVTDEDPSAN